MDFNEIFIIFYILVSGFLQINTFYRNAIHSRNELAEWSPAWEKLKKRNYPLIECVALWWREEKVLSWIAMFEVILCLLPFLLPVSYIAGMFHEDNGIVRIFAISLSAIFLGTSMNIEFMNLRNKAKYDLNWRRLREQKYPLKECFWMWIHEVISHGSLYKASTVWIVGQAILLLLATILNDPFCILKIESILLLVIVSIFTFIRIGGDWWWMGVKNFTLSILTWIFGALPFIYAFFALP